MLISNSGRSGLCCSFGKFCWGVYSSRSAYFDVKKVFLPKSFPLWLSLIVLVSYVLCLLVSQTLVKACSFILRLWIKCCIWKNSTLLICCSLERAWRLKRRKLCLYPTLKKKMASVSIPPPRDSTGVDKLPEEMNDMKIRDDKVCLCFLFLAYYVYRQLKWRFWFLLRRWKRQWLMVIAQRLATL